MRIDGGEARKITEAKEGVTTFALSHDGKWLVYRSGKAGEEQLYRLPIDGIDTATPDAADQAGGRRLAAWRWAPDGKRIYFVGPESSDADEKARREKKFTVDIRNAETPLASLWAVDLEPRKVTQLTKDADDHRRRLHHLARRQVGRLPRHRRPTATSGTSPSRTSTATRSCSRSATGEIERLIQNVEVGESAPELLAGQPVGRLLGARRPHAVQHEERPGLPARGRRQGRQVAQARRRRTTATSARTSGRRTATTIYFNDGIRATTQLVALDVQKDAVRQITSEKAALSRSTRRGHRRRS